jgi:hypothetical protein
MEIHTTYFPNRGAFDSLPPLESHLAESILVTAAVSSAPVLEQLLSLSPRTILLPHLPSPKGPQIDAFETDGSCADGFDFRGGLSALEALPMDSLLSLFSFLDVPTVLGCAAASPAFALVCDRPLTDLCPCAWRDKWRARFGDMWMSPVLRSAAARHHAHWDPMAPSLVATAAATSPAFPLGAALTGKEGAGAGVAAPASTWRQLFFDFEESWLDWALAGQNWCDPAEHGAEGAEACRGLEVGSAALEMGSAALEGSPPGQGSSPRVRRQRCLLGLQGAVYDVGRFVDVHPGSPETLLHHAGGDTTDFFNDVGHSRAARRLLPLLEVLPALEPVLPRPPCLAGPSPPLPPPATAKRGRAAAAAAATPAGETTASAAGARAVGQFLGEGPSGGGGGRRRRVWLRRGDVGPTMAAAAQACAEALPLDGAEARGGPLSQPHCAVCGDRRLAADCKPSLFGAWGQLREVCRGHGRHVGRCRTYFDPFERRWGVWWTCCHAAADLPPTRVRRAAEAAAAAAPFSSLSSMSSLASFAPLLYLSSFSSLSTSFLATATGNATQQQQQRHQPQP